MTTKLKLIFLSACIFHILYKVALFAIITYSSRRIKSVLYFKCIIVLQNDYNSVPYKLDQKILSKFELLKLDIMTSIITTELKKTTTSVIAPRINICF